MDWCRKWLVDFNARKTQLVSFDRPNNNGVIDVKMDGSDIQEKPLFFSSKLDWGSYIISTTKTASKEIGALIRSMTFLSPEVDLCFSKSTIPPCMEYSCRVWDGALSCYLEMLKLWKRICWTVGSLLAASLKHMAYRRNLASLSLFWRYYFGRCWPELVQLVPLPYSWGRSTRQSNSLHIFLSPFLDIIRTSISTIFSPHSWTLKFSAHRIFSFDL